MHVAQITVAVTRDLITKYHYFHTSFQIWPDQIKGGREGEKTAPLAGSLTQGWLERGQESASSKCPQGPAKEAAARDTNGKGESQGSGLQQSGGRGLREGPQGMETSPQGRNQDAENITILQFNDATEFPIIPGFKQLPPANAGDKMHRFDPWVRKIPWRRAWQPTPVSLTGKSHRQRCLVGYSSCGHRESDTTEVTQHACVSPDHSFQNCVLSPEPDTVLDPKAARQ